MFIATSHLVASDFCAAPAFARSNSGGSHPNRIPDGMTAIRRESRRQLLPRNLLKSDPCGSRCTFPKLHFQF
jgi:hypothetical protein